LHRESCLFHEWSCDLIDCLKRKNRSRSAYSVGVSSSYFCCCPVLLLCNLLYCAGVWFCSLAQHVVVVYAACCVSTAAVLFQVCCKCPVVFRLVFSTYFFGSSCCLDCVLLQVLWVYCILV